MSGEHSDNGEVHPSHVGPPDLILQEIIAPSDVPEDIRERFEAGVENRRDAVVPTADGGFQLAAPGPLTGVRWADVTFAARALALIEGTDQPDCDGYGDPMQWVLALSADSPVLGEQIFSDGGFVSSSVRTRYATGEPPRRGERLSYFAAIRTEPRRT